MLGLASVCPEMNTRLKWHFFPWGHGETDFLKGSEADFGVSPIMFKQTHVVQRVSIHQGKSKRFHCKFGKPLCVIRTLHFG